MQQPRPVCAGSGIYVPAFLEGGEQSRRFVGAAVSLVSLRPSPMVGVPLIRR